MTLVPHQLILFGPPGTSKSHRARKDKAVKLEVDKERIVPVTFHPDFSYGEFAARLLPLTQDGRIEYRVHPGPFVRALALAYLQRLRAAPDEPAKRVVLLVDEINRGNCAEIFGDVFQLLDRDDDGWSSYEITVSDLVLQALRDELARLSGHADPFSMLEDRLAQCLVRNQLCLPPNLHMIGTMNTSDESIYFMDSAFKRRWHFEFCPVGFGGTPGEAEQASAPLALDDREVSWETFLDALNQFIRRTCTSRQLDDKLIGPWFIKARRVGRGTLGEHVSAQDWKALEGIARTVKTEYQGADNSSKFEKKLLEMAEQWLPGARKQFHVFAEYDDSAVRKFAAIQSSPGNYSYYRYTAVTGATEKGLLIMSFIDALKDLEVDVPRVHIGRGDIEGKLFLYLWDNVFARDKSPLADLLDIEDDQLRTFDQFVAHSERFIDRLCPVPEESTGARDD